MKLGIFLFTLAKRVFKNKRISTLETITATENQDVPDKILIDLDKTISVFCTASIVGNIRKRGLNLWSRQEPILQCYEFGWGLHYKFWGCCHKNVCWCAVFFKWSSREIYCRRTLENFSHIDFQQFQNVQKELRTVKLCANKLVMWTVSPNYAAPQKQGALLINLEV